MSSDIERYIADLEVLANSDLASTDKRLLENFKDFLEDTANPILVHGNGNHEIFVNLFIEDMKSRKGPFQLPCSSKWTGLKVKEKIYDFFNFPLDFQTLMVESILIKDEDTLTKHGINKSGDTLCVFLLKRKKRDISSGSTNPTNGSLLQQPTSSNQATEAVGRNETDICVKLPHVHLASRTSSDDSELRPGSLNSYSF